MREKNLLIEIGKELHKRNWVPATGGNLSVRLSENSILITKSGVHKGYMTSEDFLVVDFDGNVMEGKDKPSAETLLHIMLYKAYPWAKCVLHVHSLNSTVISRVFEKEVVLENYELLKAFEGINTHQAFLRIPIFDNSQNMYELYNLIYPHLTEDLRALILRSHGIYTWASSIERAYINLEAIDFLLECELKLSGGKK